MSVWNVFKMELYKNAQDRVNLTIMLALMVVNVLGGFMIANDAWNPAFSTLYGFSVFASMVFLFVYPYQMARADYKSKVMSLLIASGMSRVQYYFVKIGATLLFSFASLVLLVFLPILIVLAAHDMSMALEFLGFAFEIDAATIGIIFLGWLSAFSMLMTAVIISKGKGYTIFVFLGLSIATSQLALTFRSIFGSYWWQISNTATFMQHFITMTVMGLIGILILRKQDL